MKAGEQSLPGSPLLVSVCINQCSRRRSGLGGARSDIGHGCSVTKIRNPCNYEGQYRCRPGSTTVAAPHGRTAMVRDVLIVLIGIVLPIILLLFLAWHYLL